MYMGCKVCEEERETKARVMEERVRKMTEDVESAVKWAELNGERASLVRLKMLLKEWKGNINGEEL